MSKILWIAMIGGLAGPVLAAPTQHSVSMSAAEFESYVSGHTVTYAHDGQIYGMEQYLPGRLVVWRHMGGDCQEGRWFEQNGEICFAYDGGETLQCWEFYAEGGVLEARATGDPDGLWLYEVQRASEPLTCPAPYLGT